MRIKIVRVDKTLPLPEYKTAGAVAFDLYARETATVPPQGIVRIPANFIVEVPEGHALLLASRSGTYKKGLRMANGVGLIDQDFHGPEDELGLVFQNFTDAPVAVERGERIAQAVILPIIKPEFEEVDAIKDSSRGGFGTTGDF